MSTCLQRYSPKPPKAGLCGQVAEVVSGILGRSMGGWYMERMVTESQQSGPVLPVWFPTANKEATCLSMNGFNTHFLAVNVEQK